MGLIIDFSRPTTHVQGLHQFLGKKISMYNTMVKQRSYIEGWFAEGLKISGYSYFEHFSIEIPKNHYYSFLFHYPSISFWTIYLMTGHFHNHPLSNSDTSRKKHHNIVSLLAGSWTKSQKGNEKKKKKKGSSDLRLWTVKTQSKN